MITVWPEESTLITTVSVASAATLVSTPRGNLAIRQNAETITTKRNYQAVRVVPLLSTRGAAAAPGAGGSISSVLRHVRFHDMSSGVEGRGVEWSVEYKYDSSGCLWIISSTHSTIASVFSGPHTSSQSIYLHFSKCRSDSQSSLPSSRRRPQDSAALLSPPWSTGR